MKKFFAMLLAAMMLLSCVSAMAEDDGIPTDNTVPIPTRNDSLTASTTSTDKFEASNQTSGKVGTELWLQVSAQGQIDVTVPLTLVFATNIDGGNANTASTYGIKNYSTADLKVTGVKFVKSNVNPLELVEKDAIAEGDVDQFEGRLTAAVAGGELKDEETNVYVAEFYDAAQNDNYGVYSAANAQKLFTLPSAYNADRTHDLDNDCATTDIKAEMETSRLSFVTDQTSTSDTTVESTKGVQLLTVVYTIAVDDADHMAGTTTVTSTEITTGEKKTIGQASSTGSGTNP